VAKLSLLRTLAIISVLSLTGLSGCTSPTQQPRDTQDQDHAVEQQPADDGSEPYATFRSDLLLNVYTVFKEAEFKCLAQNGYPQFDAVLPKLLSNSFTSLAETPDFGPTLHGYAKSPWFDSEEEARESGFGHAINARDAYVFVNDPEFAGKQNDCAALSLQHHPGARELISGYINVGNNLARAVAKAGQEIKPGLMNSVYQCMAEKNHRLDARGKNILPDWQVDFGIELGDQKAFPRQEPSAGENIQIIPAVEAQPYVPTEAESDTAADVYRCSVETGARDSWASSIKKKKLDELEINSKALGDLTPALQKLANELGVGSEGTAS
jgi:hypothetical protein